MEYEIQLRRKIEIEMSFYHILSMESGVAEINPLYYEYTSRWLRQTLCWIAPTYTKGYSRKN